MHSRRLAAAAILAAAVHLTGCSSAPSSGNVSCGLVCSPAPLVSLSSSALSFTSPAGIAATTQTSTLTNIGTVNLLISSITPPSGNFSLTANTCGSSLAPNASCSLTVGFLATGSGTYTGTVAIATNASATPQLTLSGTATGLATTANTVDCSTATGFCPNTFTTPQLASDPIATGGFHGYADPSERKDPNSVSTYLAYSWPHTLADGTHVVDLHLASSANNGTSFTEVGPLYQSAVSTQTTSSAYSAINDTSTETIDLLPISISGTTGATTLWVQAHQSYLVKPTGGIYDQLNATNLISVSAVQLTAAQQASPSAAGTALLGLATAPEARLGAVTTDPSRNITQNLATLSSATSKCANWGQPALWYQSGTLYLALECTEITGTGQVDANELAHFVYATTPSLSTTTGPDASTWTWTYVGEFATGAQAAKLGSLPSENIAYQFFTEPQFALTKSGQLVVVMSPSVFAPQTSQQPVIQYACRVIPVTLTPSSVTLDIDATTGAPVVLAKVTESDLYTGVNEGPGACTYEPSAVNGVIMARKYENDPTYGFFIYPVNSGIAP